MATNFTKTTILVDIASIFKDVGSPVLVSSAFDSVLTHTHFYSVTVTQVGYSEQNQKSISSTKDVGFMVYDEGQGDEAASYVGDEPVNDLLKDVTIVSSSYLNIANLYNSDILQRKCLTGIITQAAVVFQEGSGYTNHTNRMKLVALAMPNPVTVVWMFMASIALNGTVQGAGALVADSVILSIISGSWDSIANLLP